MAHTLYKRWSIYKRIKEKLLPRNVFAVLFFSLSLFYPCSIYPDNSNRAALCFREVLIIASRGDSTNHVEPMGGYCIQVESIGPQGREFLVHVYSSMTADGYFGGTRLISSLTEKLQCLEEKHTES